MAVKVMPDDYQSITPYLVVSGVATLLDFLTQAFEAHALPPCHGRTTPSCILRLGLATRV